jgi:integrase
LQVRPPTRRRGRGAARQLAAGKALGEAAARGGLVEAPRNRLKPGLEPKRARLTGEQVQVLLQGAGEHRTLIATAIMAGGLRVSELTHLLWRDVDLRKGVLNVAISKTAAGVRQVVLDPELVQLLREHKMVSKWSQPDDFVFAGRLRDKRRERNSVRPRLHRCNRIASRDPHGSSDGAGVLEGHRIGIRERKPVALTAGRRQSTEPAGTIHSQRCPETEAIRSKSAS